MDWIALAQDRDRWRTLVNAAVNLWVLINVGCFLSSWGPFSFSGRCLLHGVGCLFGWLVSWLQTALCYIYAIISVTYFLKIKLKLCITRWSSPRPQWMCAWSTVWLLAPSCGCTSPPQTQSVWRTPRLLGHNVSKLSNDCICALLWDVLEFILHICCCCQVLWMISWTKPWLMCSVSSQLSIIQNRVCFHR
jgi:hypothetical protein